MHEMTGGTGDPFGGMFGVLPVEVLLVMLFCKLVGIDVIGVTGGKGGGFIIRLKRFSRSIAHRPAGSFFHGGFAPVVARSANLNCHTHGQLGRVDDGLAFFKNRRLGKGRMP